ncbi:MAG TPA: peptidylprolyl isomerase [Dinghuibacter sp.]|uniref:peptidylprolyl isomerase n=1 Tax=Dinghuibacter sp. TaxID=2024697 RepID=UPI002B889539|nr:peptidylprolyl isomerase [Dinghuibacter sp.]HTJ13057.1 peptidylprolyl isomerase [Dinghuibacter sp.]
MKRLLVAVLVLAACKGPQDPDRPHIVIETQAGDIEVELYPKQAPKSVAAFLSYIDAGLYKNGSFYRILSDDNQPSGSGAVNLIQGGIWQNNAAKARSLPGIPHETTQQTHILHKDGTISLARTTPGSASSEFFIVLGDQPGYDYGGADSPDGQGYAAFGRVVKGMDVVKTIYRQPEKGQTFTPTIPIHDIVRE